MRRHLDVAVGIADAIANARSMRAPLDIEAETRLLTRNLVVSGLTAAEVADVLRSEAREAGLQLVEPALRH